MIEKYFVCSGADSCGKLFIGTHPDKCPDCGGTTFKQGIENFGHQAKQELAAHKRAIANERVKAEYRLKRGK